MERERDLSPPYNFKTSTMTTTTTPTSSPPDFDIDFSSIYHSIFPPGSCTTTTDDGQRLSTEHSLHQARLVLENRQLSDHYDLCFSRLQSLNRELETLRQENADLRLANAGLLKILTNSFHRLTEESSTGFSPKSVIEPRHFEKRNFLVRDTVPKSISVRSNGYLKAKQTNASTGPSRHQAQRVHVPAGNKAEDEAKALELEVYKQGMWKTELCNKWQETGTCPYGEYCQFAHGIHELRPVIRHPKYKTALCRMVLSGATCPYGHRCHFRHSFTEEELSLLTNRRF